MRHFSARTLPAPEMSALAEHLASCDACQNQFRQTHRARRGDARFSFTLAPEAWLKHEHLQYEQIAPYLDGGLDGEEREILELHLRVCESCQEDVRSLREFRREIAPEMSVSYAPTEQTSERKVKRPALGWLRKPAYAAVAIAILVTFALVATLSLKNRREAEQQAQVSQPASGVKDAGSEKNPSVAPQITANDNVAPPASVAQANTNTENMAPPAEVKSSRNAPTQVRVQPPKQRVPRTPLTSAATVAELNDGGQKITIDSAGNVTGLDRLTPTDVKLVKETLLAQNVTRLLELAELVGEHGALRGNPVVGQSFKLISPARTVTADDRPTFKWEAIPGATSYRVYIGDAENREVASSGELLPPVTEWTPSAPLPRGKVYAWAVIAKINGSDVIVPAASQPEVKFKVLSEETLRDLTALQSRTSSHLALGIFYVRAGMLEDAEREFQALNKQNPQSPVAMKLLRSVQSWR